jgi:cell division protease FtsH
LANLVNEAALLAARKDKSIVDIKILELAKDKVMMGPERRSIIITDKEKTLTAYHESGHALLCLHMPDSDPMHKVTIIPRGSALGLVMRLPEDDRRSVTLKKLKTDIAIAMGGRAAEEFIFGSENITTGAASDIQGATELARKMVISWGLSAKIGPVRLGVQNSHYGYDYMSESTSAKVDEEVRCIVEEGYKTAQQIIKKHEKQLHLLAKALLKEETLTGEEAKQVADGKQIVKSNSHDENGEKEKNSKDDSNTSKEKQKECEGPSDVISVDKKNEK